MNRKTTQFFGLVGAVFAAAFAGGALAQSADATAEKFLSDAIRGNIAEVRMGELAQQRGKSKDVRDFGKQLVEDHTMGLEKTSALAKTLGVTPPTQPPADAIQQHEKLSKLSGEQFDAEFAHHMAMGHEKEIAKYTAQTHDGGNPEVAELAKDTLPTLQKHLETAESLQKNLQSANRTER